MMASMVATSSKSRPIHLMKSEQVGGFMVFFGIPTQIVSTPANKDTLPAFSPQSRMQSQLLLLSIYRFGLQAMSLGSISLVYFSCFLVDENS